MTCKSNDLVYVVICSACNKEDIRETGEGKTKARDRVRVHQQNIHQLQYQQIKCEQHFQTCGKEEFKILPLFKLYLHNKYLREQYEKYFRDKFKTMLH